MGAVKIVFSFRRTVPTSIAPQPGEKVVDNVKKSKANGESLNSKHPVAS